MPRCGPPSSVRTVDTVFSSLYVAPFPNWTLTTYPNVMGHIVSCFDTGFNNAIASMFSFEIPVLAHNICFRFAYVLWITISQITQLIRVMCWLHRDIATTTRLLRSIALNLNWSSTWKCSELFLRKYSNSFKSVLNTPALERAFILVMFICLAQIQHLCKAEAKPVQVCTEFHACCLIMIQLTCRLNIKNWSTKKENWKQGY